MSRCGQDSVGCSCGDMMQEHMVHEVASLYFCPTCRRVVIEDPEAVIEYRLVKTRVLHEYGR